MAALIAVALVVVTSLFAYWVFRRGWRFMCAAGATRSRVLYALLAALLVHLVGIALYASVYFLAEPALGGLRDATPGESVETIDFFVCFYFSAATYSSLGFGDIVPVGDLRLVAVLEGLNGLLLIGWSVAYSFVAMDEFWENPTKPRSS
jgi:hypothetical protein